MNLGGTNVVVGLAHLARASGRCRTYGFGEVAYMLLGLGTTSALAWLVFANVLHS